MTNNEIAEVLYKNKMVENICSKFKSYISYNIEDLEQHIYLTLLEISNKKLNELYESDSLFYYIYYIVKAQAISPTSTFNKTHSNYRLPINYNIEIHNDKRKDENNE